ncbi:DedA family protein [Baekduia sp.]|jgi:membrane protein DedA with SNARE-associated domain|uniref:DedA family protein n=1 Tax=Baekduia sp. TaxID=2600305 RepID=UPI002DFC79ED|nr:DedA family protein [Baekduia sp.]
MSHLALASITSSLTDFIGRNGVYAVFLIMAADAMLPVGGELTMLYAGALAGGAIAGRHPEIFGHVIPHGLEAYLVLAAAGTIGYLVGSLIGWAIGHYGGRPLIERHGRWLHLSPQTFERAERWFERRGSQAVLLGRLTPVVRSFISIPAGVLQSPLGLYTVLTLIGSAIWCFGFALVGWGLGDSYDKVHHAFTGVEVLVVIGALAAAAVLLRRRRRPLSPTHGRTP